MVVPRNIQAYPHRNIKKGERRRPRKCHELPRGGNDQRSGRLNGRMHGGRLRLKAERWIWRRESERVSNYYLFNLFNRRLYDAGEGFQFGKGILRHSSQEGNCQTPNIDGTCITYRSAVWAIDVADWNE